MKILVSGMMAAHPGQGGATWAVLQYVLGLRKLEHDVFFVERVPDGLLDPAAAPLARSRNAAYFNSVVAEFALAGSAVLLPGTRGGDDPVGATSDRYRQAVDEADLLLNISGVLPIDEQLERIPVRLYLDLDPGFVQIWHKQGVDVGFAGHTHFATIGQGFGREDCFVPTCGLRWIETLQPVMLDHWSVAPDPVSKELTSIGNWRAYGSLEHDGIFYGQKAHSLRPLFDLPERAGKRFALALRIHSDERDDLQALADHGWLLLDPDRVAGSPGAYRRFIRRSWAEFGLTKSGYVAARCGWFSDRSACYLASGLPVIAQDTGFGRVLPTGEGLLAFHDTPGVVEAIESLQADYSTHRRRAREIAESYFESSRVLARLIESAGGSPARSQAPSSGRCADSPQNPFPIEA